MIERVIQIKNGIMINVDVKYFVDDKYFSNYYGWFSD